MLINKKFRCASFALIVLWIGASLASGQTPSDCPTISVTGPASVTEPGGLMEFNGKVEGNVPENLTYRWSLSDEGEIFDGQGTLRLRVRTPQKSSFNILATLKVLGLPAGCANSASETAPVTCQCTPLVVDEFPRLPRQEQIARIGNAIVELGKHPGSKLFVIEYFLGRASERAVTQRIAWTSAQLKRAKLALTDFEIVFSESAFAYPVTRIYIVPPGAENPTP